MARCTLQVLMSQSVILALCPFAVACAVCAVGNFLMPIETRGRALLVSEAFCLLVLCPPFCLNKLCLISLLAKLLRTLKAPVTVIIYCV